MRELTHEELGMVSGGRRDEIVIYAPRRRPRSNAGFSPFNIGVFSPARSPFYLIAPEPITDEDLEISRAQNSAEDDRQQEIEDLQEKIAKDGGWTRETLQAIEDNPEIELQDVVEPGIYEVEFNVLVLGEHKHFVLVDKNGDHRILTGHKEGTKLRVENGSYSDSDHNPIIQESDQVHRIKKVDVGNQSDREAWAKMEKTAKQINDANLNYHLRDQNSNSANRTLADAAGLEIKNDRDGRIASAYDNNLNDEIDGGPQANPFPPRFFDTGGNKGSNGSSSSTSSANFSFSSSFSGINSGYYTSPHVGFNNPGSLR